MPWLDQSGLTLDMPRQLPKFKATDVLPRSILRCFGGNLVQNRRCLDHIADQFATINERFCRAVNFAVLNSLSGSLFPRGGTPG